MLSHMLAVAMTLLLPVVAAAHGQHGGAKPIGQVNLVSVGRYQVELLSRPSPLAPGRESQIVAKVFKNSPLKPASGGRVFISVAPAGARDDFQPAPEMTWAGSYTVPFTPAKTGPHRVRVALAELEGQRVVPPLVVDFRVGVGAAPGMGAVAWSLVAGHRLSLRAYPDPRTASRALMPMAALAFVLTVAGIVLLNQPMAMRHGM